METINKALHHPMPFTTGGQTINDRLTAAKHSLSGSQLGKTICKATTEELMAPKKKHLDYLLHCTHEPNVSIPQMANLLIERTQNPNWTVVYKSLITIHNIMCYGNERFSQYLASCNTTFNLGNYLDKGGIQGYDMSQHVRRYGKYISEKIYTYRLCAFDFCKVKRGREDGLLRTMHADKILKTIPILQNQIDALLEFQVSASELNNGVINCSFILLFRDLIRLFACYNDGIINLLEKYFDMNKKQCREALDMYKSFLVRLDKVAEFLKVAESVGIDRGEIPDLARAPASLLEALEAHVIQLEGGRPPPPSQPRAVSPSALHQLSSMTDRSTVDATALDDSVKNKYLEEEKERLRMYEEQRKRELNAGGSRGGQQNGASATFNPFGGQGATPSAQPPPPSKPSDDLLNLFDAPLPSMPVASQQPMMDSTNPFATGMFSQPQPMAPPAHPGFFGAPSSSTGGAQFGADFSRAFPAPTGGTQGLDPYAGNNTIRPSSASPMMGQQQQQPAKQSFAKGDLDSALSSLANNLTIDSKSSGTNKPVQWGGPRPAVAPAAMQPMPGAQPVWGAQQAGMAYGPPPGMYGQPMMNMYGQPMPMMGMQPGMVRPAYGMQPGQQQPQQQQPSQPSQDPFGQF